MGSAEVDRLEAGGRDAFSLAQQPESGPPDLGRDERGTFGESGLVPHVGFELAPIGLEAVADEGDDAASGQPGEERVGGIGALGDDLDEARPATLEQGRVDLLLLGVEEGQTRRAPSAAGFRARAKSVETGATGLPEAKASDLTAPKPMRMPVKEPGPTATANALTSRMPRPAALSRASIARKSRAEWVSWDSRQNSPRNVSFSRRATEPLGVVVSTARMCIARGNAQSLPATARPTSRLVDVPPMS